MSLSVNYGKEVHFCCVSSRVGILGNERADATTKSALQLAMQHVALRIPHTHYKRLMESYFTHVGQHNGMTSRLASFHQAKE